jgi:hypothetical protein
MKFKYLVPYTFVVIVITILITVIVSLIVTRPTQETQEITNDVVIERIEDQFFAVTKTVYSDQQTEIEIDRSNDVAEFLWGKTVVAEARVRVDVGVDLQDIKSEQIRINQDSEIIEIETTGAQILDTSVEDDLQVETEGTIITQIFDNTNNDDYREAISQLENAAERSVLENEELLIKSEESAEEFLNYLFAESGYTVRFVSAE